MKRQQASPALTSTTCSFPQLYQCRALLLVVVLMLLVGCAPPVPEQPAVEPKAEAPPDLLAEFYQQAALEGAHVYGIDPDQSEAWLIVGRGGTLASFGHDHAIAAQDFRGFVMLPDKARPGRTDLAFNLITLAVDPPELRAQAGLGEPLSDDAVSGTRRNMHEKVLHTERFPWLVVRARSNPGTQLPQKLIAAITLHGVTREYSLPVKLEVRGPVLVVEGQLTLSQRDFDIPAFSVFGGALRVEDALPVTFKLRGAKLTGPEDKGAKTP
jgi:hypothetical protein